EAEYFLGTGELHERTVRVPLEDRVLYRFPWDVIGIMKQTIPHDLANVRLADSQDAQAVAAVTGEFPIEIAASAKIYPGVVLDNEHGAIVIHEHAVIRPGSVLVGPCAIGEHSTVIDRAFIKANTVIGPWCKAAGEVGGTIFQGYSNKAHDGHLGDCWVGEWVNFGAGTTNSNLLNTYGEVTMRLEPTGARHRTGLQFLGAIIGDHAKFAICTRIMTGTVVGTGAMIATSAPPPTTVTRFAWLTDEGSRVYKWEKFMEVARTVMGRRSLRMSAKHEQMLKMVYDAAMVSAKK
ncbi:MAG TPA: hypothetical protein VG711_04780, partial [Phycisphaerales bacterium]|nr:hypothetical protein [Phycisphaerales bacterium]